MDTAFCLEALEEAFASAGSPRSSTPTRAVTRDAFTEALKERGIRIIMDERGSWRDNVFVERLWRSIKYASVSAPVAGEQAQG